MLKPFICDFLEHHNVLVVSFVQAGAAVFPETAHLDLDSREELVFRKRYTSGLFTSSSEGTIVV